MRVDAYISFYKHKKLQGWRLPVICCMTGSKHCHAHLEFDAGQHTFIFLTVDSNTSKLMRIKTGSNFLKAKPYSSFSIGTFELVEEDIQFLQQYPQTHPWKLIKHQIYKWLFLQPKQNPVTCITFISDFLKRKNIHIPRFFSPKELWDYLNANNFSRR